METETDLETPPSSDPPSGSPPPQQSTVVLAWYQNPVNVVTMIVTAALVAGMLGWLLPNPGQEPHNKVDVGFLQDMREHHEQAWVMSLIFIDRPDVDEHLRVVAAQIMRGQAIEVGRMVELLAAMGEQTYRSEDAPSMAWMGMTMGPGEMPGLASDEDLDLLATLSGREADELFVRLMSVHHESGIHMAEYAADNGKNDRVIRMAEGMAHGQRGEIIEMDDLLQREH